jgi:ER membrane protein complex subunit 2
MHRANISIKDCIQRLDEQFPKSPRVEILQGQRIEATDLNLATKYYESLLESDETNVVCALISQYY